MKKIGFVVLSVTVIIVALSLLNHGKQLLLIGEKEMENTDLILYLPNEDQSAIWDFKMGNSDSTVSFDLSEVLKNIIVTIGLDHPNGTKVVVVKGDKGYNLINSASKILESAFDEFGELKEGYYVEVSSYDIDKDGTKEILMAIGNKTSELGVSIFKYSNDNFSQVGYISGSARITIYEDGRIETSDRTGLNKTEVQEENMMLK